MPTYKNYQDMMSQRTGTGTVNNNAAGGVAPAAPKTNTYSSYNDMMAQRTGKPVEAAQVAAPAPAPGLSYDEILAKTKQSAVQNYKAQYTNEFLNKTPEQWYESKYPNRPKVNVGGIPAYQVEGGGYDFIGGVKEQYNYARQKIERDIADPQIGSNVAEGIRGMVSEETYNDVKKNGIKKIENTTISAYTPEMKRATLINSTKDWFGNSPYSEIPTFDTTNEVGKVQASGKLAELEVTRGKEYAKKMDGKPNIADQLDDYINDYIEKNIAGFKDPNTFFQSAANIVPSMTDNLWERAKGFGVGFAAGGGTALALGQLGPQVAAPEEILTVPAAGITTGLTTANLAGAYNTYNVERGNAYADMIAAGVDEQTAREFAGYAGTLNAGIEFASMGVIGKAFGLDKLASAVSKEGLKNILSKQGGQKLVKFLSGKGVQGLAKYGITIGTETAEEIAQEASTMTATNAAIKSSVKAADPEAYITPDEFNKRLVDTGIETAKGMAVIGGAGAGAAKTAGAVERYTNSKRLDKVIDQSIKDPKPTEVAAEPTQTETGVKSFDPKSGRMEIVQEDGSVFEFYNEKILQSNDRAEKKQAKLSSAQEERKQLQKEIYGLQALKVVTGNKIENVRGKASIQKELKRYVKPEFVDNIDKIPTLNDKYIESLIDGNLRTRISQLGKNVSFDKQPEYKPTLVGYQKKAAQVIPNENDTQSVNVPGQTNEGLKTQYNVKDIPSQPHIDDRSFENVGDRSVLAYQEVNAAAKPHIQDEAKRMMSDLDMSQKGEKVYTENEDRDGIWTGNKRSTSPSIARILDEVSPRPTYDQVKTAIQKIINDGGSENNALSKKIELIIDDNLTNGTEDVMGNKVEPNKKYIESKGGSIKEAKQTTLEEEEDFLDALAAFDGRKSSEATKEVQTVKDRASKSLEKGIKRLSEDKGIEVKAKVVDAATDTEKQVQYILGDLGIKAVFYEGDAAATEMVDTENSDIVLINKSKGKEKDALWAAGHGFYHTLKQNHSDLFDEVLDVAKTLITDETRQKYLDTFTDGAIKEDLMNNPDLLAEEIVADEMGNLFSNKSFWSKLYQNSKILFEKVYNIAKNVLNKMKNVQYDTYLDKKNVNILANKILSVMEVVKARTDRGEIKSSRPEETEVMFSKRTLTAQKIKEDLVVLHNISGEKIVSAIDLGGLPVPSLAVTRDSVPFTQTGFGSITLVGTKEMIDPEKSSKNKTFNTDVYSKRVPNKKYKINNKKVDQIVNTLKSAAEKVGDYRWSIADAIVAADPSDPATYLDYKYGNTLKYKFLEDNGVDVKIPMKDKYIRFAEFNNAPMKEFVKKYGIQSDGTDSDSYKNFTEYFKRSIEIAAENNGKEAGVPKQIEIDLMTEAFIDPERNNTYYSKYIMIMDMLKSMKDGLPKEIDRKKLTDTLSNKIKKIGIDKYKKWVDDMTSDVFGESYFESGNKKLSFTLDNLFEYMTGKIRGQEKSLVYGPGNAKSMSAEEFRSIKEMHDQKDIITNREKIESFKDQYQGKSFAVVEKINYKYDDFMQKMNDFYKSMGEYFQSGRKGESFIKRELEKNDFKPTDRNAKEVFDLAEELRNAPVQYFESKPQRIVRFYEFKAALISKVDLEAYPKAVEALENEGITVIKYDGKGTQEESDANWLKALKKAEKLDKNIKFSERNREEKSEYPLDSKDNWWGEANYQDQGGKLVNMTPDEFLEKSKPLKMDEATRENVEDLKDHVKSGRKLDPLVLYRVDREDVKASDGRHRAIMAKELGYETVPVIDYTNSKKITDTAAFKKWFGNSEVVDENGDPLVVYHGTKKKFTRFDNQKSAQGIFWFSSNKQSILDGESGAASRDVLMPVYLSAKKLAGWDEYDRFTLQQLVDRGYDGIKLDDDYVVFEPNQIKSVDNNGDFSTKNNDINFSTRNKEERDFKYGPTKMKQKVAADQTQYNTEKSDLVNELIKDGPTEGTITKRSDIVEYISEFLNIPIAQGKFREKALGIFKPKRGVIRLKQDKDLDTLYHEVGHYFDRQYKLSDGKSKELMDLGEVTSRDSYTDQQVMQEGVAEFFRYYMIDQGMAEKKAPEFYKRVRKLIEADKQMNELLTNVQVATRNYMNQDPESRLMSNVSVGREKGKMMNAINNIGANLQRLYTLALNDLNPIENMVKDLTGGAAIDTKYNPAQMATLSKGWKGRAQTFLEYGILDDNFNKIDKSFKEVLKPVNKDLKQFRAYVVALRAKELQDRGIETGILKADAAATIAKYKDNEKFNKAVQDLLDFQDNVLKELVKVGIIGNDAYEQMRELNKQYVPFYRVIEQLKKGGVGKGYEAHNPTHKIKGSTRDIVDPLESIIKNTFTYVQLAERNRVGLAFAAMMDTYQDAGKIADKVPANMMGESFKLGDIKKALIDSGADVDTMDLENIATIFKPARFGKKDDILTVFIDGKPQYYQIFDKDIYRSLFTLDKEGLNTLMKILNVPSKTLRAGATLTPEFAARNPLRDTLTAFLYSKYGFTPVVDTLKGLWHVMAKDDLYYKWLSSGAAQASFVSSDRNYTQEELENLLEKGVGAKIINAVKSPIESLAKLSEFMEEATRVGVHTRGLKKEGFTAEGNRRAALNTRESTLDFGRGGEVSKQANVLIAFFNATMQGTDRAVRAFKDRPFQTLFKVTVAITLPSVALTFMNYANDDDDRKIYEELPRWLKDTNWVYVHNGVVYRFPKPQGPGVWFSVPFERSVEWLRTNDPKAFEGISERMLESISPTYIFTALQPYVEAKSNYSMFRQAPVIPTSQKDLEGTEQFGRNTTDTAKMISSISRALGMGKKDRDGKGTGISPLIIENTLYGYTGGLGKYAFDITDLTLQLAGMVDKNEVPSKSVEDLPLIKAFMYKAYNGSQSMEDFYDRLGKVTMQYQTYENNPTEYKIFSTISSQISKLRKEINTTYYDTTMTGAEKKAKIDELNLQMVDLARSMTQPEIKNLQKLDTNKLLGIDQEKYAKIKKALDLVKDKK